MSQIYSQVLCEWSEGRNAWDVAVTSLGAVIASTSRPWSQHSGALSALLALGKEINAMQVPSTAKYPLLPLKVAHFAKRISCFF